MRKYCFWLVTLALIAVLCGCAHPDGALNDPIKPPGDSPYNNNSPNAKGAPPAPGPPSNVPSPGGGKRRQ